MDPRIILASEGADESLTLRLALNHPPIFLYLWSTFSELYTFDLHLVPISEHLAKRGNYDQIQNLYFNYTT